MVDADQLVSRKHQVVESHYSVTSLTSADSIWDLWVTKFFEEAAQSETAFFITENAPYCYKKDDFI